MVLKACAFLLLGLAASWAWADFDPAAYDRAVAFYKRKQYASAADTLQRYYDFSKPDVPWRVPQLAVLAWSRVPRWDKTSAVVDRALRAHLSWWPPADANTPQVGERLKAEPLAVRQMMYLAADGDVRRLTVQDEELTPQKREQLKAEIKLYADALAQTDYIPAKVQALTTRMQDHEDMAVKSAYHWGASVTVSYWTWEDRPNIGIQNVSAPSHAEVFTPCFGVSADYSNAFSRFSFGACAGSGKSSAQFDNGTIDTGGHVTVIDGYAASAWRISDATSIGAEAHILDRTISASAGPGLNGQAIDQNLVLLAVGQFRVWKFDLRFKGGTMVGTPSAVWQAELALPVY